ncbi:hypothetical protein CFPG_P2-19 (plasmid) [Candidatus Azobacteroides pseudotrichonymphae genomovar. CFP2]|uniref:Uncharacterized protein n=2 Tax=Candidatus Azobacteroides TaxID=511434 RepID=B6YSA5_AZOPC|nr:hypothetical protein CFPG_P2-19 [Candidatus Azobacteroides pseudotrichonymphae genomovar. CFP2]
MKKLLNTVLLTFVFLGFGFHLANGTKIYMIHPAPPALETTIDRAWFWDNELTIKMTNGREFYNKSEWVRATYYAKLEGSNVKILLKWLNDKNKDGDDINGKHVYNLLYAFFTECGANFTPYYCYYERCYRDAYSWTSFTLAQADVESIKIE